MMTMLALIMACATAPPASDLGDLGITIVNGPPSAQPSGSGCSKAACSLGDAGGHGLSEAEFVDLLDQWATEPLGESTLALDTLLFDASRSQQLLAVHGGRLPEARQAWLEQELARSEVAIEMRLVDEHGSVRGTLASEHFSLREKQHLVFEDVGSLGWLETGGKVKRVGLAHLWSRW
jgi:hypothetical protein